MTNEWLSINDETGSPVAVAVGVPFWLTNGRTVALAVRFESSRTTALRSQYQLALGFEWPENPTHYLYATPPLPEVEDDEKRKRRAVRS